MIAASHGTELLDCFTELSDVPLQARDKDDALARITALARRALGSHACVLALADLEKRSLTPAGCASADGAIARHELGRTFRLGTRHDGDWLDYDLLTRGEMIERHGLAEDGQGVANPRMAARFGLHALLCCPIWSDGRLLGCLGHFSSGPGPFTENDRQLLAIFAHSAAAIIDRFDYQHEFKQSLETLNGLSPNLMESPTDFLGRVCETACSLLGVSVCLVWRPDAQQQVLKVVAATAGVDEAFRSIELPITFVEEHLAGKRLAFRADASQHAAEVAARGWVSLLRAPLRTGNRLIGLLDVYTRSPRSFREWEKESFAALANHVALSIQRAEDLIRRERFERLNEIIQELTQTRDLDTLLKLILDRAPEVVSFKNGWISRLNHKSGRLEIVKASSHPSQARSLGVMQGVTGMALREGKPIQVDDVRSDEWRGVYEEFWTDTRSELAVPIMVENAQIREGKAVQFAAEPIGVLNIESPQIRAFSQTDEDLLCIIARHAAILIERFESDRKAKEVAKIEQNLVGRKDWDEIIQDVIRAITDTLGYDYINISLVVPEHNVIRTEYFSLEGMSEDEVAEFKLMACHSLHSNDIQADIVRKEEIEVPAADDPRFDRAIYQRFNHEKWVRVFVPMKSSGNRVLGTVEAGYQRESRKHIYEKDVQVLQSFVTFATRALEQRKRGLLDQFGHEFRQPIAGIRNNVSFLQWRLEQLSANKVQRKFEDMLLDCEILLHQVEELEYVLGRPAPAAHKERTIVFRDVIIKTVQQLKPLMLAEGLDPTRVHYRERDIHRIVLFMERAKLNQVVYNLLNNSIKYAEDDPDKFFIGIYVSETDDSFTVKFRDRGIGVRAGLEEKIFENGFRTPEAIAKHVNGSGLGLTVALSTIRELGGNLRLANNRKPTEFHLILPKSLREALTDDPNDR